MGDLAEIILALRVDIETINKTTIPEITKKLVILNKYLKT